MPDDRTSHTTECPETCTCECADCLDLGTASHHNRWCPFHFLASTPRPDCAYCAGHRIPLDMRPERYEVGGIARRYHVTDVRCNHCAGPVLAVLYYESADPDPTYHCAATGTLIEPTALEVVS